MTFAQCVLLRVSSPFLLLFWRRKDPTFTVSQRARLSAPTWEKPGSGGPAVLLWEPESQRYKGSLCRCASQDRDLADAQRNDRDLWGRTQKLNRSGYTCAGVFSLSKNQFV